MSEPRMVPCGVGVWEYDTLVVLGRWVKSIEERK
jgi:hypothetical protein